MIPAGVIQVRSDICADCPTPCEWQRDAVSHADACSACRIRRWGAWGACKDDAPPATAKMRGLGDAVAAVIERRVLTPAEKHAPSVVAAARKCGGCTQAKHALGSTEKHPDPGTVI